jgi:malonate transporter and related proteins
MDHEPGPVRGDRTVAFRREVALVETVLTALAPVVVTLLLGFVAAWHHDFAAKDAAVLNRMVLLYAVPVALFVGTVGTPRSELVQDVAFAIAMFVAIVGMYALVFLFFRLALRFSLAESVLAALAASAPAAPFMGPAVLGDLFGKASAVSIAIAALVINLVVVPITMLGLPLAKTPVASTAHPTERYSGFSEKLRETFKNRSYGHRYSLSRSFCATSKSLRFSAMDFRF